ncbi:MAG: ester cyclase [Pseudomonadota bacterium]
MSFQSEKQVVLDYYAKVDAAPPESLADVLSAYAAPEFLWRGMHPFHEINAPEVVATAFWGPLRSALTSLQRRMDVFMAGANAIDDGASVWVVSMGHLMGLFDTPWLGIPPTGKLAMLRYAAFHRVEGGRIAEEAMFCDIPHLMMQAGLQPFPPQTAAQLVQPGPLTNSGLLFEAQPEAEGKATLAAINFMVEDLSKWTGGQSEPLVEELRRSWHEDMVWWGPTGIGATYTVERYSKQHSGPFREAFGHSRRFKGHIAKIAEGEFGGFFGWPNLTLEHQGGFMGMPATGKPGDMRVIDIYRRRGEKLAENWIFIDLLHFWNQQGLNVLARPLK